MSKLYVPDETYLVCSSGMHVQQLKVNSQHTIKIDNLKLGATLADRTGGNFICAKMVIAGAIAGAIFAAAMVATGGLAGVALGTALAAGVVAGAGVGLAASFTMPCLCAIFTMPHDWAPVHPKVTFEGKKPLIETSKISCMLGGVVSIYFSEEAADAQASYNRANTLFTVGTMAVTAYLGGVFLASAGAAVSSVAATYTAFGLTAASMEALGGLTVLGGAYGVNKLYDFGKKNIKIGDDSIDSYVTGEKYKEEFESPANTGSGLLDVDNKALDNSTSAEFDAMGRGTDAISNISKAQTSDVTLMNESSTTTSYNKVFLANSNGDVLAPGNTQVLENSSSSTNSNPVENPIYNKNGGTVESSTSISTIETDNLRDQNVTERVTTTTTQFEGSYSKSVGEGFKEYGNGMFNPKEAEFYKTGFGLVVMVDAARAAGNWMLAEQIEGINESQKAEEEAKSKLSVKEDEA